MASADLQIELQKSLDNLKNTLKQIKEKEERDKSLVHQDAVMNLGLEFKDRYESGEFPNYTENRIAYNKHIEEKMSLIEPKFIGAFDECSTFADVEKVIGKRVLKILIEYFTWLADYHKSLPTIADLRRDLNEL